MNPALLEEVVKTVLYEGCLLYPYRPSAKKNRREQFTFGRVYPQTYSEAQDGKEPFGMQTECLVKATAERPRLRVSVGFLHLMVREGVGGAWPRSGASGAGMRADSAVRAATPSDAAAAEDSRTPAIVAAEAWNEAVERKVAVPALALEEGKSSGTTLPFRFPASRTLEAVPEGQPSNVKVVSRTQETVEGSIEVAARCLHAGLFRITVRICNHTHCKDGVLMRTLVSTHTILGSENGEFISLFDPPAELKSEAAECRNIGTWPVLVGDEQKGERDTMLSSPSILYDYPRVAIESAGARVDGAEIDEALTLQILRIAGYARNSGITTRQGCSK